MDWSDSPLLMCLRFRSERIISSQNYQRDIYSFLREGITDFSNYFSFLNYAYYAILRLMNSIVCADFTYGETKPAMSMLYFLIFE